MHLNKNPNVAAAILVHENTAEEPYVLGISVFGKAKLIGFDAKIKKAYSQKLNRDDNFWQKMTAGDNPHWFYKLIPKKMVLFDNKNFPDEPRQEIIF